MKRIFVWGIAIIAAFTLMISSSIFLTACKSKDTPKDDDDTSPNTTVMTLERARDLIDQVINDLSGAFDNPEPAGYSMRASFPTGIFDKYDGESSSFALSVDEFVSYAGIFQTFINRDDDDFTTEPGQTYHMHFVSDEDGTADTYYRFDLFENNITLNLLFLI